MAQIAVPILKGLVASDDADFMSSLPVNYEPVVQQTGIAAGYLRAVPGIAQIAAPALGAGRGGIIWNGIQYRVMGSSLVQVVGSTVTVLGDVGDNGLPVSLDFSFDLLAIASNGDLFYWDGSTLKQVTDPDLGLVLDVMYLDGRFITTDGNSIVLTELNDPYSVDPLKYGSAEVSPDPILGLNHIRGEMNAAGSNTIENFRNIGGSGFPYQRQPGALIAMGAAGTHAFAYVAALETFFFVGSGPNSAPSVWVAGGGQAVNISTQEVDTALQALTDDQLALVEVETREDSDEQRLMVHLPDRTLVYLAQTSKASGEPVWCELRAGTGNDQAYPLRHLVYQDGQWFGDTADGKIGRLDTSIETLFGAERGWRFDTLFVYNQSVGGIINSLELVGLTGRAPFGAVPHIFFSYTKDGTTWSNEKSIESGRFGQRQKRCQIRPHWRFTNYLGIRMRGAGNGRQAWASLQADVEGLAR
jgi:hypothetical protein